MLAVGDTKSRTSPSGFVNTMTVLFTGSGMFPAASAGAEYVMVCSPSNDVTKFLGEAVTVRVYKELLGSDTVAPRSAYLFLCSTVSGEMPFRVITGFTVSIVTNEY